MSKRIAKSLIVLSVASAFAALPAVSSAKHGADDGPTHHHRHHHDDRGAHRGR
jgi:hypothetical protein